MIKRITALVLVLMMTMSATVFGASFSDVAEGTEYEEAISVLTQLGVLSGMGDGTFSPYTGLTRAQFAKIAVGVMGKNNEAVVTTDAFSDVDSTDWYSGYVNVVAGEGIITGYPDGSFGANDPVTYAQAITILIRLLGYDASDVGHKWPQGYVDKAKVLGITENVEFSYNDTITRERAALLIYRSLFADIKGTDTALVTKMDSHVYEDTVIVATNSQNAALLKNQIQTNNGVFTTEESLEGVLGCEGTLVADDEGNVIVFVQDNHIEKEKYTIQGVYTSEDNICIVTKEAGTINLSDKTTAYMSGESTTLVAIAEGVNTGSTITLFKENNSLKYAFVDEYKHLGPEVVKSKATIDRLFNITDKESLKVIRKGVSAAIEDIELYDVLYYSERTNTIYVYADRVTGVYEEAYPMKSNVSRVTVSGNTYYLSTQAAVNKLNESEGAFDIGDRVTLLLGEDKNVVDVVSLTDGDISLYGVITQTGTRISDDEDTLGRTEHYVTIMNTKGEEVTYVAEGDSYKDKAGEFCEINFENGFVKLSFIKSTLKTGVVDKDKKAVGDCPLAKDYAIMEYEDGNGSRAVVTPLTLSAIDGIKLLKNNVKHVQLNAKGEITVLYLNNVSGNRNTYGIIIDVPETKTGTYTILSGTEKINITGTYTSLAKGEGVMYYKGLSDDKVSLMTKIATGTSITSRIDNVIRLNGVSYTLSDDVTVYAGSDVTDLKTVSLSDALTIAGNITLYSDKSINEGGKIRVIRIIGV